MEALSPNGDLHAAASIASGGGFAGTTRNLGILSAVTGGAGIVNITLAPGYAIDPADAFASASARIATNADEPNVRHLTDTTLEVRTFVANALTNMAFDLRIIRVGVG